MQKSLVSEIYHLNLTTINSEKNPAENHKYNLLQVEVGDGVFMEVVEEALIISSDLDQEIGAVPCAEAEKILQKIHEGWLFSGFVYAINILPGGNRSVVVEIHLLPPGNNQNPQVDPGSGD